MTANRVAELVIADRITFAIRRDAVLNPDELAARGPRVLRNVTLISWGPGPVFYEDAPASTLASREELWPGERWPS